jgi:hypothetical protein
VAGNKVGRVRGRKRSDGTGNDDGKRGDTQSEFHGLVTSFQDLVAEACDFHFNPIPGF